MYRYIGTTKDLQMIGIPCIVISSIERSELLKTEFTALSNNMICIYLNDNYHSHDFDSIIHNRVNVLEIIKFDSDIFKTLTNIENWNEKIHF